MSGLRKKRLHEETKGKFDESLVNDFDLSEFFEKFRSYADRTRTECDPISVDDKMCTLVLAFAGIVDDSNQLGGEFPDWEQNPYP